MITNNQEQVVLSLEDEIRRLQKKELLKIIDVFMKGDARRRVENYMKLKIEGEHQSVWDEFHEARENFESMRSKIEGEDSWRENEECVTLLR